MALAALVRSAMHAGRRASFALALGVLGAALFYGDSLITPAISVLSAVEGVEVVRPELADWVLPIAGRHPRRCCSSCSGWAPSGSGGCSGRSWPLWFVVLAVLGLPRIIDHPDVLLGLSPDLHRGVLRRPPVHGVHRDGRRGPGDHRRRGALRRHGPLRPPPHPPGLVRRGVPRADHQLPRAGRADPARPGGGGEPLLPARARLGPGPADRPRDRRDRDRVAGGDLGGVLGVAAGGPAGLPPAADGPSHVGQRERADLRAHRELAAVRGCAHPGRHVPVVVEPGHRLRARRHRHAADLDDAVPVPRRRRPGTGRAGSS